MILRQTAVAGQFYPDEPGALGRWFNRLMVPDEETGEVAQ